MIQAHVYEGAQCIDATMGNGNDTEYLCRLAGESGYVMAFDIQEQAVEHTRERLRERILFCNYELICDSHSHLLQYVPQESADCIVFNLGYLPGGDHRIATRPDTTLKALEASLRILKKGGLLHICIYSGGDTGFEERDAVLEWMKKLDSRYYLVLVTSYYNRPNHPPIPAMIIRL